MKAIYPKFAALSFAAILFAACSDSTSEGNSSDNGKNVTPVDVTSLDLTSQDIDLSRVENYKLPTTKAAYTFATRAGATSFVTEMPKVPEKPADALNLNTAANLSGKTYVISGQKTLDFSDKKIENCVIFVNGASTLVYGANTLSNSTIVLLSSATLHFVANTADDVMVPEGCTVYCASPKNNVVVADSEGKIDGQNIIINGEFYAQFRETKTTTNADETTTITELSTGLGAITETTKAEKEEHITPTQNITFGPSSKVFIDGSIRAINLKVEEGANVYAKHNLFNTDENKNGTGDIEGNLQLEGFIKSANLTVTGNLIAGAAVKVTKNFNVNAGAEVTAAYINVTDNSVKLNGENEKTIIKGDANLNLNGNGKINLVSSNVIVANNLITDNSNSGQITLSGNDAVAVIKANVFKNNSSTKKISAFATTGTNSMFLFQFKTCYADQSTTVYSFEDMDITGTYLDYDKTNQNNCITLIDSNNKKYGYKWVGSIEALQKGYKLDLLAAEEPGDDGKSASCIQTSGTNIYVGYHTYGDKAVGGKIEQLSFSGNTLSAGKSIKSIDGADIDYNHMMLDGNALYLAGSQQGDKDNKETKAIGAFLGKVDLTNGNIGNKINLYSVNETTTGVDANCVAKYGDNYVVATTKGFTVLDKDFSYSTHGSKEGKYVVTSGNTLYTLDLDRNNNNNSQLNAYSDASMATATQTVTTTSPITPRDNKAVMAIDGNVMYVCKGENGIDKIDLTTGTATSFWTCPTFVAHDAENLENGKTYVKGHCNGIAVKGDYIYVAHGSYGVVVLDKKGGMICHRKSDNGKSANFITVDDNGNIYVAYGKSRVHVFKMTGSENMPSSEE